MLVVFRIVLSLALLFGLVACSEQSAVSPTLAPALPPTAQVVGQPTAPPTQPPTAAPTQPPTIAATQPPTAASQPTAARSTATALAAATATPAPASAPTTPAQTSAPATEYRYAFPVRSDGKISYGKFHHDYPAADIFCPVGSVFVAVTDGVVDFVSPEDRWDPQVNDGATRGGLSVAIVGDDGVRYYGSHLSQVADGIAPGVRVTAGQQLGLTGQSGDARVTPPHLHFGISHPTTPEDWVVRRGQISPYPYLQAWQRGENLTPDLAK